MHMTAMRADLREHVKKHAQPLFIAINLNCLSGIGHLKT
jgi:hypothetical protein